jgi:hypothetical protein
MLFGGILLLCLSFRMVHLAPIVWANISLINRIGSNQANRYIENHQSNDEGKHARFTFTSDKSRLSA